MTLYEKRVKELDSILDNEEISLKSLQNFCFNGIPDCNGYRSLCWKILLGYLGLRKSNWSATLRKKRQLYKQFIDELVIPPGGESDVNCNDHPLCEGPESAWSTFFKDNEVLLQIDKDVRRLCPDISFFQQPTEFPCEVVVYSKGERRLHSRVAPSILSSANVERKGLEMTKINLITKRAQENYRAMDEGKEAHWEVVERILFIYAKLNPGINYVQGMNEIVGPIYFVMASDPNIEFREHAEADCFFCFTALMGEMKDFFIKTLDESESGIKSTMNRLSKLLQQKDPEVWSRLKTQELHLEYYAFRWLTLLLSQEFPLPDVVRIWDSVFSDANCFLFLIHFCCAMTILIRDQIISQDFANNVKILQNYPPTDVNIILAKAVSIMD